MTTQLLLIIHVLVCLGIVGLVLIQHGKGADAGAAFGSGASGTVFGSGGSASFLTKLTAMLAVGFFATSMVLAMFAGTYQSGESVVTGTGQQIGGDDDTGEGDTPRPGAEGGSGATPSDGSEDATPAPTPSEGSNSGSEPERQPAPKPGDDS